MSFWVSYHFPDIHHSQTVFLQSDRKTVFTTIYLFGEEDILFFLEIKKYRGKLADVQSYPPGLYKDCNFSLFVFFHISDIMKTMVMVPKKLIWRIERQHMIWQLNSQEC